MSAVAPGAQTITRPAYTDLSDYQFRFVKMYGSSKQVTICAAATDIPIGVLQNDDADAAGKACEIVVVGPTKIESDEALTEGALIGTSADGQADMKVAGSDTIEYICGQVTEASGAAGDIVEAFVNCASPARAA